MSTQNLSEIELAAEEIEAGINFEKNLKLLNEEGEKGNIFALKTLGFLYSLGVFNYEDKSKNTLIDIQSEESEKKAREYFSKAAALGSVHAKIWLAMGECIRVAVGDDSKENENDEKSKVASAVKSPAKSSTKSSAKSLTAQDFLNAEQLALHAIEESKKEDCDCTQDAVDLMYHWLARVYDCENPVNPIHDEKKAKKFEILIKFGR